MSFGSLSTLEKLVGKTIMYNLHEPRPRLVAGRANTRLTCELRLDIRL